MWGWLSKTKEPKLAPIHPPWRAGQYVTYFLQREDGSWVAFTLHLLNQEKEGVWLLRADFKTERVDNQVWLRVDDGAPSNLPGVVMIKGVTLRGTPGGRQDPESVLNLPSSHATLAENLLLVRRWAAAAEALRGPSRHVDYPCGITEAYPLVTPTPFYQKHQDLHPRVMLTGVACVTTDGGTNPMTVTSFGLADRGVSAPTAYEDFVDLSNPKDIEYPGFALTYPATWFLRVDGARTGELETTSYSACVGGVTCAATLSAQIQAGPADRLSREFEADLARLSRPMEGPMGRLTPDSGEEFPPLPDGAQAFAFDLQNPAIDGRAYHAIYHDRDGGRQALLTGFACVSMGNPRRGRTAAEMRSLFRKMLGTFRFI